MIWKVKRIFEDDYGCEERMPGEKKKAIVRLVNEEGKETEKRVDDDWLYENGIDENSIWPFEV